MKYRLYRAKDRGYAEYGWLNTYHTFSFGDYFDREKINFGALRVLNDDTIAAGMGFGTHPHDNMEIITIPIMGTLEHKDSSGGIGIIRAGDIQVMSAGKGIEHSEYNHSQTEPVSLFQIWIRSNEYNVTPRYDQKNFDSAVFQNTLFPVVVGKEQTSEDTLWIYQDVKVSLGYFESEQEINYSLDRGKGVFLFVVEGSIEICGEILGNRDGIGVEETVLIKTKKVGTHLLTVEVPLI